MEIPKYIERLIQQRANLASRLNRADYQLSTWLEDREIIAVTHHKYK